MSLVKVEVDALEVNSSASERVIECCDKHVLIDSRITITNDENNRSYINIQDFTTNLEVQHIQGLLKEKDHQIMNLEKEIFFLKDQVLALNNLLNQLSASTKSLATRNDIRINVSNLTYQKWYRRPKVVLTGSAIVALFSVYLRYKIKNW